MTKTSHRTFTRPGRLEVEKLFYQQFKPASTLFAQQIQGIPHVVDQLNYASLLLNRLLVLYFLQKQHLLDDDIHYLSNRLHHMQQQKSTHYFYRQFLLALFSQLYSVSTESSPHTGLIGVVPHLALPLFAVQEIERTNECLQIPDSAFAPIFTFFDLYNWQINANTPQGENELHPDILAYIFERSIDQKQSGAYYTQEDITTYIVGNTVVACLLTGLVRSFPHQATPGSLLQADPDRYIQHTMRSTDYLAEETEIEYKQRRACYTQLHAKLHAGTLQDIDDLITYNLDLPQIAMDIIHHSQDHNIILAIYMRLKHMLILDPTCGTGAFLLSALATLTPLYAACIERMQEIAAEQRDTTADTQVSPSVLSAIKTILTEIETHPTPGYFILSTIITQNLYGVDLMPEAVDICQLCLSLALAATGSIERGHMFVPPLNIRVGNALVGNLQNSDDRPSHSATPALMEPVGHTSAHSESAITYTYPQTRPFDWYKEFPVLTERGGFDVIIGNPPYLEYSRVRQSYAVYGYEGKSCGNLYAAVIERSLGLCHTEQSYLGLIVPISICNSERFAALRQSLFQKTSTLWLANFEIFPSRLFENAFQRVSIVLAAKHQSGNITALHVTKTHRWFAQERSHLLQCLTYTKVMHITSPTYSGHSQAFPKFASLHQECIIQKMLHKADGTKIATFLHPQKTRYFVYYQEATNYWTKAVCSIPYYRKNGEIMTPSHGRFLFLEQEQTARIIMALMNSSLFYIWFITYADGFHLSHTLVKSFPVSRTLFASQKLYDLALLLEQDIQLHTRISTHNTRNHLQTKREGHQIELEEYQMRYSKNILDEVDKVLAQHYSFTTEELTFIVNYDIKYRISKRGKK